jgi:hypothetical protein
MEDLGMDRNEIRIAANWLKQNGNPLESFGRALATWKSPAHRA